MKIPFYQSHTQIKDTMVKKILLLFSNNNNNKMKHEHEIFGSKTFNK